MSKVFLSYSQKDRAFVQRLYKRLTDHGVDCFFDRESIPSGTQWIERLHKEIEACDWLVLVLTPSSLDSYWPKMERNAGLKARKQMVPLVLKKCKIPNFVDEYQALDATSSRDFEDVFRDLYEIVSKSPNDSGDPGIQVQITQPGPHRKSRRYGVVSIIFLLLLILSYYVEWKSYIANPLRVVINDVVFEFVQVPAGQFQMGSNLMADEVPIHDVQITTGFQLGKYEVTQEQWKAVIGSNITEIRASKRPIGMVSWEETQGFLKRLNDRRDGYRYRLPTEAEWEYSARAGTSGDYAGNLEEMAWYGDNSGDRRIDAEEYWNKHRDPRNSDNVTPEYNELLAENANQPQVVGQKKPNPWGLYDMHGNVWEWINDWYQKDYYTARIGKDPKGPSFSPAGFRVIRGGSCGFPASFCRSARRYRAGPLHESPDIGFRILRQLEPTNSPGK